MARVAAGRRLVGREDLDEEMNVNESGAAESSGSSNLVKRSRTRGITSVDNGC